MGNTRASRRRTACPVALTSFVGREAEVADLVRLVCRPIHSSPSLLSRHSETAAGSGTTGAPGGPPGVALVRRRPTWRNTQPCACSWSGRGQPRRGSPSRRRTPWRWRVSASAWTAFPWPSSWPPRASVSWPWSRSPPAWPTALRERHNAPLLPADEARHDGMVASLRRHLGAASFAAAEASGRSQETGTAVAGDVVALESLASSETRSGLPAEPLTGARSLSPSGGT